MTPQQAIYHAAAGAIIGYAAAAWIRHHFRFKITINWPTRSDEPELETLDFDTPCSVGPHGIIPAFEDCPEPAEWDVQIHACTDEDPDGWQPLTLCTEHLNRLSLSYARQLHALGYVLPCGKEVEGVLDVIHAERIGARR
jgi:hypothetical protein